LEFTSRICLGRSLDKLGTDQTRIGGFSAFSGPNRHLSRLVRLGDGDWTDSFTQVHQLTRDFLSHDFRFNPLFDSIQSVAVAETEELADPYEFNRLLESAGVNVLEQHDTLTFPKEAFGRIPLGSVAKFAEGGNTDAARYSIRPRSFLNEPAGPFRFRDGAGAPEHDGANIHWLTPLPGKELCSEDWRRLDG
jgi:hypothetical protein